MSALAEIKDVSDTAFWVAHYRALESDRTDALFRDPLAKLLTAERGAPIDETFANTRHRMAWTVVMRTVLIDEFIQRGIADGVDAVVNLGAGLDTRPYRLALPSAFQWVEADFPHMVEFKRAKLQGHSPHCQLQQVGVDLADADARRRFLAEVVPGAKKALVLTEGVVPYLTEAQVADLAADLLAQKRLAFWLAEYFSPEVYPYLRAFARTPMLANSPFRFFPEDWTGFFLGNGWQQQERRYSTEVAQRFNRMPPTPWWARWVTPFMSQEAKDRARPRTGFMLMTPRR
jgi:methyltransferase (TIGR00027 family)